MKTSKWCNTVMLYSRLQLHLLRKVIGYAIDEIQSKYLVSSNAATQLIDYFIIDRHKSPNNTSNINYLQATVHLHHFTPSICLSLGFSSASNLLSSMAELDLINGSNNMLQLSPGFTWSMSHDRILQCTTQNTRTHRYESVNSHKRFWQIKSIRPQNISGTCMMMRLNPVGLNNTRKVCWGNSQQPQIP